MFRTADAVGVREVDRLRGLGLRRRGRDLASAGSTTGVGRVTSSCAADEEEEVATGEDAAAGERRLPQSDRVAGSDRANSRLRRHRERRESGSGQDPVTHLIEVENGEEVTVAQLRRT